MEEIVQSAMLLPNMLKEAFSNPKPIEFVRRLMMAECSKGDKKALESQYLNLPKDHGVYFQDTEQPLMNANDHVSNEHILQFGRCTSDINPKNMASKAVDEIVSNPLLKMVCPMAGVVDAVLDIKDKLGGGNCKCVPKTVKVWEETNEGNCLDGADGILNTSHLVCCYGGIITIKEMSDGENSDQSGEEEPTKKTVMERMPKSVAESVSNLNESADTQDMESQMQDWYEQADDFDQNYKVNGDVMLSNYSNNKCQDIPMSALNDEGYIADMSELSGFRMGGSSAALCGAGCASAYNAMHALGMTQPLSDVIMSAEIQQPVPGYMDQGPMAVSMISTANMLAVMGFQTNMMRGESLLSGQMHATMSAHNGIAIVGTTGAGGLVQFHTIKADKAGKLCCMEDRSISVEKLISKDDRSQLILGVKALNRMENANE